MEPDRPQDRCTTVAVKHARQRQPPGRERKNPRADRQLDVKAGLRAAFRLARPQPQHQRGEQRGREAIERLHPWHRHVEVADAHIDVIAHPDVVNVPDLRLRHPEGHRDRPDQRQPQHPAALVGGQRGAGPAFLDRAQPPRLLVDQVALADQIDDQPDQHPEPGDPEPGVPAPDRRDPARDDRSDERAEVDREIIVLERVDRTRIAIGIERLDLRAEVAAQQPRAQHQQQQREQERGVERHREMPGGHQQCADTDRRLAPDQAIADRAAEQRHEGNARKIQPERLGRQRLDRKRPGHALQKAAIPGEPDDVLDPPRQ